jgi:predicted nucleotidyltransferase
MLQKKDNQLLFRQSSFYVAKAIFDHPNETFHLRELAAKTGFSTTAVRSAIDELSSFDIITIEDTKITKNVKANLDSESYRAYKTIFNLYQLRNSGFVDMLVEIFGNPQTIVVFGSFAKGEDIEESDIDILVLSHLCPNIKDNAFLQYEKKFNRKINIHNLASLGKSEDAFKNAVANGVVLHGYLKVV